MFCPNCGQPTPLDGLRFCRQCGFRLDAVSQLLVNGGAPLPPQAPLQQMLPGVPLGGDSPRRKGLKTGAKLMLTSAVMFPVVFGFAIGAAHSPVPLFLPFTLFLAGLARMIYARFLEDAHPHLMPTLAPLPVHVAAPPRPEVAPVAPAPPPPPRSLFGQAPNTNDLPQAPSVTEKTTGLLKR